MSAGALREPHLEFVVDLAARLDDAGIRTWLCGGWAEELRGLTPPRPHGDVDLLYPAPGFERVDRFFEDTAAEESAERRGEHTRGFVLDGVLVDVMLVERDDTGWFTALPDGPHRWPHDVFVTSGRLRVASVDALVGFRDARAARRARAA